MIAVLFPFTDIPEAIASLLTSTFDRTLIVRPCREGVSEPVAQWESAGKLILAVPAGADGRRLESLVADYRRWAENRAGGDWSFLKSAGGEVPFYGESSISRLRSEIRGGGRDAAEEAESDRLFGDRLFLRLAEEFDRHQQDVVADLRNCREMEQEMLTHLMGDDAQTPAPVLADDDLPGTDIGAFMTTRRIDAWGRLAVDTEALQALGDQPVVWLTTSRTVFEAVIEDAEGRRPEVRVVALPVDAGSGSAGEDPAALETLLQALQTADRAASQEEPLPAAADAGPRIALAPVPRDRLLPPAVGRSGDPDPQAASGVEAGPRSVVVGLLLS